MELWVTLASMAATAAVTSAVCAWTLSRQFATRDANIVKLITDHEKKDAEQFSAVDHAIGGAVTELVQQFGDTGKALREHMHLIQLDFQKAEVKNLETFIRRDSFYQSVNGMNSRLDRMEDANNIKLENLGLKMDALKDDKTDRQTARNRA